MRGNLIVVCGPTASGKTKLAVKLAKQFSAEIISADSRQVFKELKIGSAPPTDEELKTVKHHFVASHSLNQEYNAGIFEQDVLNLLKKLFLKSQYVVMAGGAGLYIDAVCKGFDRIPVYFPEIRKELKKLYEEKGIEILRQKLKSLDAVYYEKIDRNNPQRLMRALEVCMGSGKPYSQFRKGKAMKRNFRIIKIGLAVPREQLYQCINERVDEMMKNGLLDEAKNLISKKHLNALQTVGYKELFEFLEGKTSLDEAMNLIKQNTRRFAKRQMTWFRRDREIQWFAPDDYDKIVQFIKVKNLTPENTG